MSPKILLLDFFFFQIGHDSLLLLPTLKN